MPKDYSTIESRVIGEDEHILVHDVSYSGTEEGRVSAYMVVPKGHGSFPGILFGYWGNGTRGHFVPEAKLYDRGGAVCLMPD